MKPSTQRRRRAPRSARRAPPAAASAPAAARTPRPSSAGIVGPHHAAAARQRDRLHDAGIRQWLSGLRDRRMARSVDRHGEEPGHRQAGVAEPLARQLLVPRGGRGVRRMPRQAETPRRRARRSPSADRRRRARRRSGRVGGRLEDRGDRRVLVVEANRDRVVLPRILDQVTPIGREDELHAEPRRRPRRTRASGSRSSSPEQPGSRSIAHRFWNTSQQSHLLCIGLRSTVPGLVQVRHGRTGARGARVGRATGRPARSCASARTSSNSGRRSAVSRMPTSAMTSRCSASTRGSGCVQRYVSVSAIERADDGRASRRAPAAANPAGTSRRMAS